jgi:hypothetical protein
MAPKAPGFRRFEGGGLKGLVSEGGRTGVGDDPIHSLGVGQF